jgi:methyl farnesoate epoxidase/farnesoate epoxidase
MERSYGKSLGLLFSGAEDNVWKESRRFVHRTLRDFGFGKQRTQDERAHEELASLFEHIECIVDPKTRVLAMHHIFSVSVLNLIWRMVAGERFEYDDTKFHEILNVMEEVSKQYSLAGDVLMAFPKLRHILPPLTGYGKERRIFEPKLLQEFQVCSVRLFD